MEQYDDDSSAGYSDICGVFYDDSAKCNRYMGNDGDYKVSKNISFFVVVAKSIRSKRFLTNICIRSKSNR